MCYLEAELTAPQLALRPALISAWNWRHHLMMRFASRCPAHAMGHGMSRGFISNYAHLACPHCRTLRVAIFYRQQHKHGNSFVTREVGAMHSVGVLFVRCLAGKVQAGVCVRDAARSLHAGQPPGTDPWRVGSKDERHRDSWTGRPAIKMLDQVDTCNPKMTNLCSVASGVATQRDAQQVVVGLHQKAQPITHSLQLSRVA